MADRDYTALALLYAVDVVAGKIPNGKLAIQACQRALRDHKSLPGFQFDKAKANKVCKFVEYLSHVKGEKGGTLIRLEPWQCFILTEIFGWTHKGGDRDGLRRFRSVYLEVPRGNAKSTLSSAIGLYMLAADGEWGAEIYSSGKTQDQSKICWGDAKSMATATASKQLMEALGIQVLAHSIIVPAKNSKFVATSSEYDSLEGKNIHLAIIDELHISPDRGLYDVMVSGAGKRKQSMIWCITTSGTDLAGICFEVRTYITKILNETVNDESQFGCIWSADDGDDWQAEATWEKANPNWKVSVDASYIRDQATKARVTPAAINNFKTKHLDIWCSANSAWMEMRLWDRCADTSLRIENFQNQPCFIGLDLASVSDIAAKTYLFPKLIDGETHYYLFGTYYLSDAAIQDGRNSQYQGWQISGELTSTPGDVTDYGTIERDLITDLDHYNVREIGFDRWQGMSMAQNLAVAGASTIEMGNNVATLSAPLKDLERLVRTERLHHDGNKCLAWMVSNVVCHMDAKDNIFPRKAHDRNENKIDGVISATFALARASIYQDKQFIYETRQSGFTIFG